MRRYLIDLRDDVAFAVRQFRRHPKYWAVIGLTLGVPGAILSTRFLRGLLFGVDPLDPWMFGAVAAVLLLVGVAVSYVPARRAMRIDPLMALRSE